MRTKASTFVRLLTVPFLFIVAVPAAAIPVLANSGNFGGHNYRVFIDDGVDWNTANTAANALGGYLATITSAAEDNHRGR